MPFLCEPAGLRPDTKPKALHHLAATPQTVHWGYFSPDRAPSLVVESGDLIQAQAVTHHAGDAPELMMDEAVRRIYREVPEADRNPGVHIMTGPIYVKDAKPGDMLEVRYLRMTPRFRYGSGYYLDVTHMRFEVYSCSGHIDEIDGKHVSRCNAWD